MEHPEEESRFPFYAVACGKETGIFHDWNYVKKLVRGHPRNWYRGFETEEEATSWLKVEKKRLREEEEAREMAEEAKLEKKAKKNRHWSERLRDEGPEALTNDELMEFLRRYTEGNRNNIFRWTGSRTRLLNRVRLALEMDASEKRLRDEGEGIEEYQLRALKRPDTQESNAGVGLPHEEFMQKVSKHKGYEVLFD